MSLLASSEDPRTLLLNRKLIAQGGYGPVFAAEFNHEVVAVKVVDLDLIQEAELRDEVLKETLQEIEIMKKCSEKKVKNIVKFNRAYRLENQLWV
jgi:serine/threonine protein kinase